METEEWKNKIMQIIKIMIQLLNDITIEEIERKKNLVIVFDSAKTKNNHK